MKNKKGFGITEVLISAVVLGLLYMAILHMQTGNREALLRIRGRDGAIEVAQQVLDSLNRIGIASIPDPTSGTANADSVDDAGNYIWKWSPIKRSWDRGEKVGGDQSSIDYNPVVTIMPSEDPNDFIDVSVDDLTVQIDSCIEKLLAVGTVIRRANVGMATVSTETEDIASMVEKSILLRRQA